MPTRTKQPSRLSTLLRDLRIQRGLTRAQLAADAGVSETVLYQIEVNGHIPTRPTIDRLAQVLGDDIYRRVADDSTRDANGQ